MGHIGRGREKKRERGTHTEKGGDRVHHVMNENRGRERETEKGSYREKRDRDIEKKKER